MLRQLSRDGWRKAWAAADEASNGFARDILEAMRQAHREALAQGAGAPAAYALLARSALIHGSIRGRGSAHPGSLLAQGVRHGVMALRSAMNIVGARQEPAERADALARLAEVTAGDDREDLAQEALAMVELLRTADAAQAFASAARALRLLGVSEDDPRYAARAEAAVSLLAEGRSYDRGEVLEAVGPRLPPEQASRAFDLLRDAYIDQELWPLAASLPPSRLHEFLAGAFKYETLGPELQCARAIAIAARRMDDGARAVLLGEIVRVSIWPAERGAQVAAGPPDVASLTVMLCVTPAFETSG